MEDVKKVGTTHHMFEYELYSGQVLQSVQMYCYSSKLSTVVNRYTTAFISYILVTTIPILKTNICFIKHVPFTSNYAYKINVYPTSLRAVITQCNEIVASKTAVYVFLLYLYTLR